ncbi:MAG: YheC/YheD family protein [Firmicutes bacterium]|nr:YheC/YheD family protein [Bacillota bacterium]
MNPGTDYSHLRPLIGIFVNKRFFRNQNVTPFARKLAQANEKAKCSIFFFSSQHVNWKTNTINAYVIDSNNQQWLTCQQPFPDIIYDRATGIGRDEKAAVEALRVRFKKLSQIQFINSCKLKKWQLYQKLSKHKTINKYLPATTNSRSIEDIKAMLAIYDYLFLKSSGGSGGKRVFALEKNENGYCFRYYHQGLHLKRHVSNLDDLRSEMKKINLTPQRVVIQQGIRLLKYNNRPLDLRVLMVKNKNGDWKAIYNQARVAPKGAIITNASLGGEVKNFSDIYSALKKRYAKIPSDKQIKDICIIIARYIEKEFGVFGEMGIDIAVDETGKVWLLEANSKPSKLPEQGLEDTLGISPQFLMTLEYAKFLYAKKTSKPNN